MFVGNVRVIRAQSSHRTARCFVAVLGRRGTPLHAGLQGRSAGEGGKRRLWARAFGAVSTGRLSKAGSAGLGRAGLPGFSGLVEKLTLLSVPWPRGAEGGGEWPRA